MENLPVVDLKNFPSDSSERKKIATALDEAFSGIGFCVITGHGVSQGTIDGVYAASRAFHALPGDEKRAISVNDFHRGYIASNTSKIVTSSVAKVTKPNLSESFMMMHPVSDSSANWGEPLQGPNQWPESLPEFRNLVETYYSALDTAARNLVRLMALALGVPETFFDPHFKTPTVYLRLLFYPPINPDADSDQFGSAPHTDYGFLTLLSQDAVGGLQVRVPDSMGGGWIDVPYLENAFVVNVADLLAHWTGGRWKSTPHRVMNNRSGRDRYSVPFFFDPSMDTVVRPIGVAENDHRADGRSYGAYVMERFDKNYTYRQARG